MSIVIYRSVTGRNEGDPDILSLASGERVIDGVRHPGRAGVIFSSTGLTKRVSGVVDLRGYNLNEPRNWAAAREQEQRTDRRSPVRLWIGAGTVIAAAGLAWLAYSYRESDAAIQTAPKALPQVVVSKPLVRELESSLGFLGQFSAVDQVELRAQFGGTLPGIHFKDGDIVHKGDVLFTIDSLPYEIRLAQATAQLETGSARLELAKHELSVGLAAKNAILIVEFARQKQEDGAAAGEAAVHAARTRLRPILMTSFSFILGVAPLAVASGAGAEMRQSLGTAVLFGMLGVTGFGLLFTPAFYTFVRNLGRETGNATVSSEYRGTSYRGRASPDRDGLTERGVRGV
jgi:multidrug efflux pump subunit AcrA (membrane-fusion protein)